MIWRANVSVDDHEDVQESILQNDAEKRSEAVNEAPLSEDSGSKEGLRPTSRTVDPDRRHSEQAQSIPKDLRRSWTT